MLDTLNPIRPRLQEAIIAAIAANRDGFSLVNHWVADALDRLADYAVRGKLVRGGLVTMGLRAVGEGEMPQGALAEQAIQIGVVMELVQSLLLIHDDIMDQDDLRRGKPSVHAQYRELARRSEAGDPQHAGESMAICAGDAAGFLALKLLSELDLPCGVQQALHRLVTRELVLVVFAQMGDVWNGSVPSEPGFDEILRLYRYKTGRYSFSLPLMCGAHLAQASESTIEGLSELGELLGILFQIRDDEIGLFGDPAQTGKARGNDIREDKKTLHRHFLLERADIGERKRLAGLFGKRDAHPEEVEQVLAAMERHGVRDTIARELAFYAGQARQCIAGMPGLGSWGRAWLGDLLEWTVSRGH